MSDLPDGPPVVPLPERLDRRLRLGPFASARDALKFVTYVSAGAVVVPFTSPYLWLLVVTAGFVVCVVRSDGQALDARALSFVLWKLRAGSGGTRVTPAGNGRTSGQGLVGVRPGQYMAVLQTGGTPVTYLPPVELARRFELFRDLLRSIGGGILFLVTFATMRPGPVLPNPIDGHRPDRPASEGYAELVVLLCRRRRVRRVYLALVTERTGPDGISDLELRVSSLTGRLASLGLRSTRLRDRALTGAVRRWGWS